MSDFKWRHFRGEIILWAVRWYCRYGVSYRDLEQMMGERGVAVDHSTICRWVQKYAPEIEKRLRWHWRRPQSTSWRVDESYVKVRGQWTYLYRAVDKFGNTIDFYLSPTRNAKAAKRFLGKALNGLQDWEKPTVINTDKAPTYGIAIAELKAEGKCPGELVHRQVKYLNNVVEADHGKLKQLIKPVRGFKTLKTAYATIKGFDLWIDGYHGYFGHSEWEDVYIDVLDATGEPEKAQQIRWDSFEKHLLADCLRDYLKRLSDFDDVIAEEKAMAHAQTFSNMMSALDFFIEWPAYDHAARLIAQRPTEIDGNAYYLLTPAARALEGNHPLAAVLLRRAMINDTLDRAKSTRYRHAARHLAECRSLDSAIPDYADLGDHTVFLKSLQDKHRRKEGFWGRVREFSGEGK